MTQNNEHDAQDAMHDAVIKLHEAIEVAKRAAEPILDAPQGWDEGWSQSIRDLMAALAIAESAGGRVNEGVEE